MSRIEIEAEYTQVDDGGQEYRRSYDKDGNLVREVAVSQHAPPVVYIEHNVVDRLLSVTPSEATLEDVFLALQLLLRLVAKR